MSQEILTQADWEAAGDFSKAIQGRKFPVQIEESVFEEFIGSVPPVDMSPENLKLCVFLWTERNECGEYKFGFLAGEPTKHVRGKPFYSAFFETKDGKFYYAGELPVEENEDANA